MFSLRRPFRVVQQCLLALLLHSTTCLGQAGQSACLSFTLGDLLDVTLSRATYYAANTTVNSTNLWQSIDVDNLPAFCRLELSITTNSTADSSCVTEIWLPDSWNGRVLTVGNGGYAGGGVWIILYDCEYGVSDTRFDVVSVADLGYVAVAQGCKRQLDSCIRRVSYLQLVLRSRRNLYRHRSLLYGDRWNVGRSVQRCKLTSLIRSEALVYLRFRMPSWISVGERCISASSQARRSYNSTMEKLRASRTTWDARRV